MHITRRNSIRTASLFAATVILLGTAVTTAGAPLLAFGEKGVHTAETLIRTTSLAMPAIPHRRLTEIYVTATGYSSTPDQTDDAPFITAWNTSVRDGIVAANFLPLGTRIVVPALQKTFVVEDRMNERYDGRAIIDIWFPDRESALRFGKREMKIVILAQR